MTVCIAALCQDSGQAHAVIAADRMVTLGGFIEFEHTVPKMTAASSVAVAMVAGDALVGTKIAMDVAETVAGTDPPVSDIAQGLAARYEADRRVRLVQQILMPRGLDLASFYGSHQALNANIVAMVDNQMQQFNLGVEILLAGVDRTGAHIYTVTNPGPPENLHDAIGYAAIGSGAIHALQALIGFRHSAAAEYHETVFRAYAAKRRAEVAPGVGLDTDMAVISPTGIHELTARELTQLREIYEEFAVSTDKELRKRLGSFRLGDETADRSETDGKSD
jgi:hypothetical protein